jgi:hypothetical protein
VPRNDVVRRAVLSSCRRVKPPPHLRVEIRRKDKTYFQNKCNKKMTHFKKNFDKKCNKRPFYLPELYKKCNNPQKLYKKSPQKSKFSQFFAKSAKSFFPKNIPKTPKSPQFFPN